MTRSSIVRRLAAVATALALLGFTLMGCTKKVTSVDPSYTTPEGQFSPGALLVMYRNTTVHFQNYYDVRGEGFTTDDSLIDVTDEYVATPGQLQGLILDSTAATTYQVMRRETNGALHPLGDFVINPTRRWLDTHWEAYGFSDGSPSGYTPPTYIGRGLLSGVVTRISPLTNYARVPGSSVTPIYFDYKGQLNIEALGTFPRDSVYEPPDSTFAVRWTQVPGAAGYWVQIYQFTGDGNEALRAAAPQPIYLTKSREQLVAFVPAPADSYRIDSPGATIFTRRTILSGTNYLIRVSAVSPDGELVGFMYGDSAVQIQSSTNYRRYAIGAVRVKSRIPGQP